MCEILDFIKQHPRKENGSFSEAPEPNKRRADVNSPTQSPALSSRQRRGSGSRRSRGSSRSNY